MLLLLFVVHCLVAIALVGVVLLQKSEGGALGIGGGGGGGMSGFMTGRSTSNLLTRTTAILAVIFFATSIMLVKFSTYRGAPASILDLGPARTAPAVPNPLSPPNPAAAPEAQRNAVPKPAPAKPAAPAAPPSPSVPMAK